MKKITIELPDDCEVKIVKKEDIVEEKIEKPIIKTYQDLIDNNIEINGYYLRDNSSIAFINVYSDLTNRNLAISEKVAKSMLATAMISQLMPYYGGEVTNKEWKDETIKKYIIGRRGVKLYIGFNCYTYVFLAFHTEEQRDEFLKYNEQLVKDYLMID